MNTAFNRLDAGASPDEGADGTGSEGGGGPKLVAISCAPTQVTAIAPAVPTASTSASASASKSKTMLDLKVDQVAENIKSFLAEGDVINGDLEVKGGARIDGHVRGSLICRDGSAIVSESGTVDGSIMATKRVIVAGRVGQGEKASGSCVECPGDVITLGNGVIESAVTYGNVCTYDNSQITGKITRYVAR